MAINIYDRPMQAEFMDTYTPMPYQEILQAMNMRQQQHDKGVALEEDLQDTLFKVQALKQDKGKRNVKQDEYENAVSDKVASYGGEYARLTPFINEQRKKLHKDMTRGGFAAMQQSYDKGQAYLERMQKQYDKGKIDKDLKQFLEAQSFSEYSGIGEMQADGSYNIFSGEDPAMLKESLADQAMKAIKGWGVEERRMDYDKVYKRGPKTKEHPQGQIIPDANGQPQPVFYNFKQQRYVDDQEVYDSLFQSLASEPGNRLYTQQRAEMQSYGLEPEDLKMTTMEEGPDGKMVPTVSLADSPEEWENWKINKMFHDAIAPAANKAGFVQYKNKYVPDWEARESWKSALLIPESPDITTTLSGFQFNGVSGNSVKSLDENRDGYQLNIDNIIGDLDHLGKLNGIPRRDASTSDAAYFKALKGAPNIDIDLVKEREKAYYLNKRKISISDQKEKEAQSWVDRNDPRMKATKDLYGHWNPYTLEGLTVDQEAVNLGFAKSIEYGHQQTNDGVPSKGIDDPAHYYHADPIVAAFSEGLGHGVNPTLKQLIMGLNPNATEENWMLEARRIKEAYDFRRSNLDEYIDATDYVVSDAVTGYDLPGLGDSKEAKKMKAETREIVEAMASDPSTWATYPILDALAEEDDQGKSLSMMNKGGYWKDKLFYEATDSKKKNLFVDGENIQLTRDQMPDGLRYWAIPVTVGNEARKFLISEEAFNTPGMKQLQQTGLYRANELYQAGHREGLNSWKVDGAPGLEGFNVTFRYTEDMGAGTTDFTRGEVKKEVIIDGKVYGGNKGLELVGSIIEMQRAQKWTTAEMKEFLKDLE